MNWIACSDRMPTERGKYLLYSEKHDQCVGPIPWIPSNSDKDPGGMWCDLFATPEHGTTYMPPLITHWMPWQGPTKE